MAPGRVLLVAGSDCSGGAGLEAGQKVLAAHTCYAMTATTALTVQDTTGVTGIHVVPAEFVERQMEACLVDVGADVVVTGMLAAADTVEAVARQLVKHAVPLIVIDPVMVSTSGARLLPEEAVGSLIHHVLPLATIATPNLPEAQLLVGDSGLDSIRGYFVEYLLARPDVKPIWHAFLHHPFVLALGDGSLPLESFKGYIVQDYLFLNFQLITTACTAYTRYVLDVGTAQDRLALNVALAPCIMGYAAAARMLSAREETRRSGNPYLAWIRNYDGEESRGAAERCAGLLEEEMVVQSPARIEELVGIFVHAVKVRTRFLEALGGVS
ncbi:hypothetical protein CDD80_2213 [Ophiocordyceps camponoti-rufipedis]|uniref:Pyridoxamine kinase/Phosphomethylpyrimidine kinase domain-containing protein n=1 Tax=Ophiocordyceps camponoti-rufipedis TaxID=2004952 RepID=A0A2C5Z760_9HYPO|nr:hypothetical protein CDD80_2213 [Ophiocordyceps camponoti-rufipedis]